MDISPFQFGIAIAVAPVSTLVAALVIYMANNKSGKARADEIKADLSAQIKETKTDLIASISQVRNDVSVTILRTEAKIDGMKEDMKDLFRTELRASSAELRASIAESQHHERPKAVAQGEGD